MQFPGRIAEHNIRPSISLAGVILTPALSLAGRAVAHLPNFSVAFGAANLKDAEFMQ